MTKQLSSRFVKFAKWYPAALIMGRFSASPVACTGSPSRTSEAAQPQRLVIHDVRVRSMTQPDPAVAQSVIIEGEHIVRMVDTTEAALLPTDRVIDATGQFLMPGLADMHSHADTSAELARYLAHGVTLVRIMAGYEAHLETRDAVAADRGSARRWSQARSSMVTHPIAPGSLAWMMRNKPCSRSKTTNAWLDVVPVEQGGRCESNCNGSHQATMTLDDCWRQYSFSFDELEPAAWSPEQGQVDPAQLTGVQFYVYTNTAPDNQFEYWLDEIQFFQSERPQDTRPCEYGDWQ